MNHLKKFLLNITIILLLIVFFTSLIKIISWKQDNDINESEINSIEEKITIEEIENTDNTIAIEESNESLINTDLEALKEINNDVKGWIQVKGTNINYPFVQYKDNDYYLTHSFEKNKSKAGWIFMDYRNNTDFEDKNTIIFGHNRFDKSMFGSLKNLLNSSWLKNKDNHIIKISTEKYNMNFQIFSVYKIKTTSDYLINNFNSENDFTKFIKMITKRSSYNFKVNVNNNDKLLTLSTCSGSKNKLVVHAKLIKVQYK
ncbi:MAG: class B sortase [Bacilli bacterium]|nr:class B sortase [Bacilli bacterium]